MWLVTPEFRVRHGICIMGGLTPYQAMLRLPPMATSLAELKSLTLALRDMIRDTEDEVRFDVSNPRRRFAVCHFAEAQRGLGGVLDSLEEAGAFLPSEATQGQPGASTDSWQELLRGMDLKGILKL